MTFYFILMILNTCIHCSCTSNIPAECTRKAMSYNILPPIISARLSTKESFYFRYGKIEIRAKFPEGDWLYPGKYSFDYITLVCTHI